MKTRLWVLSLFVVLFTFSSLNAQNDVPSATQKEQTTPQFTPPKNLNGPVFPPEEILPKPDEQTDKFLIELLGMLATLGFIIALILIAAWFLKRLVNTRLEQANTQSAIKIIERRTLSPKSMLYLFEVGGKTIFAAESQNGVTRLAELDTILSKITSEEEREIPSTFRNLLDKEKGRKNQ
jgi:flagellar biogenesis protein FliO